MHRDFELYHLECTAVASAELEKLYSEVLDQSFNGDSSKILNA